MSYIRASSFFFGILFGLQSIVIWQTWESVWYLMILSFVWIICCISFGWKYREYILNLFGIGSAILWISFFPLFEMPEIPNDEYIFEGQVFSFPSEQNMKKILLKIDRGMFQPDWLIQVFLNEEQKLEKGASINIQGKFASTEAGSDFEGYYLKEHIIGTVNNATIIKQNNISYFWKKIADIRFWVQSSIQSLYPEDEAGLLRGLLLGEKKSLTEELETIFQETGITHIIAISGYNITLIISLVTTLFGFVGRFARVIFSIIIICFFALLVGAEASVVRASIMGIIQMLALWYGRQTFVWFSLLLTAVLMNLWEPRTLLFDIGFQLSLLATIGIVAFSETTLAWFGWMPEVFSFRESLSLTVAAQMTTFPIMLFHFQTFSLSSFVVNILVAPLIPLAMLFGSLSLIPIQIMQDIATFLGWISQHGVIKIATFFAEFDMLYLENVSFSQSTLFLCFFLLYLWYRFLEASSSPQLSPS